jgi:dTDP-4-dehydrorhamnose 3,5-epimerase
MKESPFTKTELNIVPTDGGNVLHGYLKNNPDKIDIHEVYFSTINKDQIRGWKMHKKMTVNLMVPIGKVKIHIVQESKDSFEYHRYEEILSQSPYFRLSISPGIWFAFEGISISESLICNIADLPHDPEEVLRKDFSFFKNI